MNEIMRVGNHMYEVQMLSSPDLLALLETPSLFVKKALQLNNGAFKNRHISIMQNILYYRLQKHSQLHKTKVRPQYAFPVNPFQGEM